VEHRVSVIDAPQFGELALQGADILVVPASEQETSLVPLIAMSRGVYVVASRDQSAEWFIDGETSLQFAPGSSKELAYQLTRILEGRQEVAGVLDTAREYVAENHDAVLYAPVFENILRAAQAHYATKTGAAS
jgi:glycosyltransferase involved in cell wall biosynthesis